MRFENELYRAAEQAVYANVQPIEGPRVYITAAEFESLIRTAEDVYYTHPNGEWQGQGDLNEVRFDKAYAGQALIRQVRLVADYSAVFNAVIELLAQTGGGTVVVPEGHFFTGAIELKSNVGLHLEEGAVLSFIRSRDPRLYPLRRQRFEGIEYIGMSPLICAYDCENIAVTGKGTLDGGADLFNYMPYKYGLFGVERQDIQRAKLFDEAERGIPVRERIYPNETSTLRPCFISPYRCRNVKIEGVHITGSPFWDLNPILCQNVWVCGVHFDSCLFNNDGCDPESCSDVIIENCRFTTGDDCIAVKSGRNRDGESFAVPAVRHIIRNNLFEDGHGGVTIGSEISGGCHDVFVHDCHFDSPRLDYAVRFKSNCMRGGEIKDIYVRDCTLNKARVSLVHCNFFYEEGENGPRKPQLHHVYLENIATTSKTDTAGRFLVLKGLPEFHLHHFFFKHISLEGIAENDDVQNADELFFDQVSVNGRLYQKFS